jgi:hypothetical protein
MTTKTITYTCVLLLLCSLPVVFADTTSVNIFKNEEFRVPNRDSNYIYERPFNITLKPYRNATMHFESTADSGSYIQQVNVLVDGNVIIHEVVDNKRSFTVSKTLVVSPSNRTGNILICGITNSTYFEGSFSLYVTMFSEGDGGGFDFLFGGVEVPFLVFFVLAPCIVLILLVRRHRRHRDDN